MTARSSGWSASGPSRWVRQTDFSNEEAVGYLADRLQRAGVEEALLAAGAVAGSAVLIGPADNAVVFDWGSHHGRWRRVARWPWDRRAVGRPPRRTNIERREEFDKRKAAVSHARRAGCRAVGHWIDPGQDA